MGNKDDSAIHKRDYIDDLIQEVKSKVSHYKNAIQSLSVVGVRGDSSGDSLSRVSGVETEKLESNSDMDMDKSSYGSN